MSAALLALITLVASGSSTSRADEAPTVRSEAEQLTSCRTRLRQPRPALPTLPDKQFELYTHCGINSCHDRRRVAAIHNGTERWQRQSTVGLG